MKSLHIWFVFFVQFSKVNRCFQQLLYPIIGHFYCQQFLFNFFKVHENSNFSWEFDPGSGRTLAACLIHASRTRATGACTGQSSGERVSNTWVTCPSEGDNIRKRMLKPHRFLSRMTEEGKEASASADGWTRGALASWWGNGSPRPWCIADLRGWSATLGLRHGPNSYGRQQ